MARKYGKKASEKIGQTLHEFKRGKLKSGSGKKVTSRKQAIAIGLSQARRAGYKVPPEPRGHATMSLDARVRAYLSNMRPGTEIDGWGVTRALKIEPIAASHALERAEKAGLAVTSDGRWFGPASSAHGRSHHSKMLSSPVVLVDTVTMPTGKTAEIHIHHGKGGYSGVLVLSNGNELPMSLGVPEPKTAVEAMRGAKKSLAQVYGRSNGTSHATRRGTGVEVDTSFYRRNHGAEPRGSGNWTFVIGKREYAYSDDPALYRPAVSRGVYKGGHPSMPFAKAKEHAISEAKRRGATIIGVGP